MNIKCYNTRSHSSILHFSILYIFFVPFFLIFIFFSLMTSLDIVMQWTILMVHIQLFLIHMALWNFVLFFFQSPDISHNLLNDFTSPSWALPLPTSITPLSDEQSAAHPTVSLKGRKLLKPPNVRWQVMITLERGIMWLPQEEGPTARSPAEPFEGSAGLGTRCLLLFWMFCSSYFNLQ